MKRISENVLSINDNDKPQIALRTSVEPRGYIARQVTALARRGGAILHEGDREPWSIDRVLPVEGEFYLAGPAVTGETLEELLPDRAGRSIPVWLTAFLRTAIAAQNHPDLLLCNVRTSLVTEDNGILLLDADLAREINRSIPADHRNRIYVPYNDARLSGEAAAAFQAAAIIYHGLSGTAPTTPDENRTSMTAPVQTLRPNVHTAVARELDHMLAGETTDTVGALKRIDGLLQENHGCWVDSIDPEEESRRREAALQYHARSRQDRERRSFWRRNRTRFLVIAAILIAVGSIPVSMIRSRLEPPRTAGLPPLEVAEGFYQAWTAMDHMYMEDAVSRGVAREVIREVTNIYVIDRVQTAHAFHSRITTPERWLAEGRPLETLPYGLSNLRIDVLRQEEDRVVLEAEFTIWRPDSGGEEAFIIVQTDTRERLTLEPTRHGWEITKIESVALRQETLRLQHEPADQTEN